jgi:hypothetical protein
LSAPDRVQRLLRLAVMVLAPTLTCLGYYTLDALPAARSAWALPAVLAYPLALIGGAGLVSALRARAGSRRAISLWALCLLAPLALLTWLRW